MPDLDKTNINSKEEYDWRASRKSNQIRILLMLNINLLEKMDYIIENGHEYTTRQEFIREAIRRLIEMKKLSGMI